MQENKEIMRDIIIIGAGPAGLTAGIYAARAGKSSIILESDYFGGQIATSPEVENYPSIKKISGFELANNMVEQAADLGVEMDIDRITALTAEQDGSFTLSGENGKYKAKSVIIACGAKNRQLGLPKEKAFIGSGISYCALCDGAFFKDKIVAVNGGGNTALEEAIYLTTHCAKVYIIHRRDEFRGEDKLVKQLKKKSNIEFVLDSEIIELLGEDRLTGIKVINKKTEETREIMLDGLFVAIGKAPDSKYLSDMITLDENGYIIAGEDCKTKIEGVFVAGDCRTKAVRQLTTATADGTVASVGAIAYANKVFS